MIITIDYSEFCDLLASLSPEIQVIVKYACLTFLYSIPVSFLFFFVSVVIKKMKNR